jgi:hypothetical protein
VGKSSLVFVVAAAAFLTAGSGLFASGPDVITGDLPDVIRWGRVGDITAYSFGTISCNVGDTVIQWQAVTSQHPVISSNLYRLRNDRFEQVGMSWLKHSFAALTENLCGSCIDPGTSQLLGVGCSDPYYAVTNANQFVLGPRSPVNAATGVFPYPFSAPPAPPTIGRRLQVHDADIDPDLNSGSTYFVEGFYITADDAAAGNDNNNYSYRRVDVIELTPPSTNYLIAMAGTTQREKPAIQAWQDTDASVALSTVDISGDGRMILGVKVTDHLNGFWTYEYALENLTSDRSAGSFSVPIDANAAIQSTGFHDVDYHSGEPFSLVDWPAGLVGNAMVWSTEDFSVNVNANALRYGTLYNFRLRTNAPPVPNAQIEIGLFKPGSPTSVTVSTFGPSPLPVDCNNNATPDHLEILGNPSLDCDNNENLDECDPDCDNDNIPDTCEILSQTQTDCDGDTLPDDCEITANPLLDCNNNGKLDKCEIPVGSPAPGGPFYCTSNCDPDCNVNGIPDSCDIVSGFSQDCNGGGVPDSCEIAQNPLLDCNTNGVIDTCGEPDCNANNIPDDCEGPVCPGILRGDMNCSGAVDFADVAPFVQNLLDGNYTCEADSNADAKVNGGDVQGFVDAL